MSDESTAPRTNMVVIYDGLNLRTFRGKRGEIVKLKPGKNVVDSSMWHRVKAAKGNEEKVSAIELLITQRQIKELQPVTADVKVVGDEDGDGDTDIGNYNAGTAIELVENTLTAGELDELEAAERAGKNRSTVIKAIDAQRDAIKPPKDSDDDGE